LKEILKKIFRLYFLTVRSLVFEVLNRDKLLKKTMNLWRGILQDGWIY